MLERQDYSWWLVDLKVATLVKTHGPLLDSNLVPIGGLKMMKISGLLYEERDLSSTNSC